MPIGMHIAGKGLSLLERLISRVGAQTPSLIPSPIEVTQCNFITGELDANCLPFYIAYLIKIIFELTGAVFLLMVIIGGYQYVISKATGGGGDEGKARVRFAIIGFLVTALSFYIVDFILTSFIV